MRNSVFFILLFLFAGHEFSVLGVDTFVLVLCGPFDQGLSPEITTVKSSLVTKGINFLLFNTQGKTESKNYFEDFGQTLANYIYKQVSSVSRDGQDVNNVYVVGDGDGGLAVLWALYILSADPRYVASDIIIRTQLNRDINIYFYTLGTDFSQIKKFPDFSSIGLIGCLYNLLDFNKLDNLDVRGALVPTDCQIYNMILLQQLEDGRRGFLNLCEPSIINYLFFIPQVFSGSNGNSGIWEVVISDMNDPETYKLSHSTSFSLPNRSKCILL